MVDVYPPNFASEVGRVRKYIPDLIQLPDPMEPSAEPSYLWSDEDIQSFVDDQKIDPIAGIATQAQLLRAAAYILVATGNNELLVLKKITTEDLETDGAAVQKQLLAAAATLFGRANAIEGEQALAEVFFEVPYRPDFTSAPAFGYYR